MELRENDFYFIKDCLWRISILDGFNSVIKCNLFNYMKNNEIESFMFETPTEKKSEFQKLFHMADFRVGHSGASYGVTMRIVEEIVKKGFDKWKLNYINDNRLDMIESVKILQRHIRRVLSDPSYMLCRKRLRYEFELLI